MKNLLKITVATGGLTLGSALPLLAQIDNVCIYHTAFPSTQERHKCRGSYKITRARSIPTSCFALAKTAVETLSPLHSGRSRTARTFWRTFHKYGDVEYLKRERSRS